MPEDRVQRKVTDLETLRALAHPRRQRILRYLNVHGPATSAILARDLGLNTGATSYHLRELARHGFVAEVPDKASGRERWWRHVRIDIRFPLRSEQDSETRSVMDELARVSFAHDVQAFERAQAEAESGGWGDAFSYSHGTIRVTLDQLAEFFEEYVELINRYSEPRKETDGESRVVLTRFFAFPAPTSEAE